MVRESSINLFVRRLRALREERWADRDITQAQLAQAIGAEKSISVPLISSWESVRHPKVPPISRLEAYATFFATKRSVAQEPFRMLKVSQLTEKERIYRDELLHELIELRNAAISELRNAGEASESSEESLWHFSDGLPITIVCARLPADLRAKMPYADPGDPDYVEIYNFADPDALIEIYGHLRATNATSEVNFRVASELTKSDYANHLVLLGGVDWNTVTRDVLRRVKIPVRQVPHLGEVSGEKGAEVSFFEVEAQGERRVFSPVLSDQNVLLEDVALFYRGPSPYNLNSTITMFDGVYARGTLGAVRALTDPRFRAKNEEYSRSFVAGDHDDFGVLTRVSVVNGEVVTPNWAVAQTRLFQWSKPSE